MIQQMAALDNVVVRLSSDSVTGGMVESDLTDTNSTIVPENALSEYKGFICQAFYQEGIS